MAAAGFHLVQGEAAVCLQKLLVVAAAGLHLVQEVVETDHLEHLVAVEVRLQKLLVGGPAVDLHQV